MNKLLRNINCAVACGIGLWMTSRHFLQISGHICYVCVCLFKLNSEFVLQMQSWIIAGDVAHTQLLHLQPAI